jgi:very-short-patch-repair endonuclease
MEQLRNCGLSPSTIRTWRANEHLHLLLPGVCALGHRSIPIEGWLTAALLYAGPGAVLSHHTAAWWWGLIPGEPKLIEVSSPTRVRSCKNVVVHHPKQVEMTRLRRFPITPVPRTLLDHAKAASDRDVRRALSEAEYLELLDPAAIRAIIRPRRAGSRRLAKALDEYEPRDAIAKSELERALIELCTAEGIPLPELQIKMGAMTVDAYWPRERVAVELDGYRGHRTRARVERDRARDLFQRSLGNLPIRYTHHQLTKQRPRVARDLKTALQWTLGAGLMSAS